MFSINKSCGCKGSQQCIRCRQSSYHPQLYINDNDRPERTKSLFKHDEKDKDHEDHHENHHCESEQCDIHNCTCEHHEKHTHGCHHGHQDKCKCKCKCRPCNEHHGKCKDDDEYGYDYEDCEVVMDDCEICEITLCEYDEAPKDKCKKEHKRCRDKKGYDLCRKKEELRCFKHCGPISQPCDFHFYNHFTSRVNLDFSGLIVVKNTGNPISGCSMEVRVTDRAGTAIVAIVSPGASVPIFVECLISLDIACLLKETESPLTETCSGEVIFDLEYCTTRYISEH